MIEAKSLNEVGGQLTRTIVIGVGPWCRGFEKAKNTKIDMRWVKKEDLESLEEMMAWCGRKYNKRYDAIIIEHIQGHRGSDDHRKWFDVRLSFKDPNAALEFKMVWG